MLRLLFTIIVLLRHNDCAKPPPIYHISKIPPEVQRVVLHSMPNNGYVIEEALSLGLQGNPKKNALYILSLLMTQLHYDAVSEVCHFRIRYIVRHSPRLEKKTCYPA